MELFIGPALALIGSMFFTVASAYRTGSTEVTAGNWRIIGTYLYRGTCLTYATHQ